MDSSRIFFRSKLLKQLDKQSRVHTKPKKKVVEHYNRILLLIVFLWLDQTQLSNRLKQCFFFLCFTILRKGPNSRCRLNIVFHHSWQIWGSKLKIQLFFPLDYIQNVNYEKKQKGRIFDIFEIFGIVCSYFDKKKSCSW